MILEEKKYEIKYINIYIYVTVHSYIPNSFLGMVEVKEKIADRWESREEGEGERPLLHET